MWPSMTSDVILKKKNLRPHYVSIIIIFYLNRWISECARTYFLKSRSLEIAESNSSLWDVEDELRKKLKVGKNKDESESVTFCMTL